MVNLWDFFFGCTHRNYSFPITVKPGQRRSEAASVTGTYVACLECGKEFPYDWQAMKVMALSQPLRERRALQVSAAKASK